MARASTVALGRRAEDLAVAHLEAQGYRVVERNFRTAGGEIDIVAWDKDVLCFVEVRSRANDEFGDPLETINPQKIRRIVHAARVYVEERMEGVRPWPSMRFDAVGLVMGEGAPPLIRVVAGAFEA